MLVVRNCQAPSSIPYHDEYLLFGVRAAEESWFGSCQNTEGPSTLPGSTVGSNVNQGLIHGASRRGCPLRRFCHTFTADFALGGRAVNVNRIMVPSASAAAEYQHALTGINALGPQVTDPSSLKAHTTIKTTTSIS